MNRVRLSFISFIFSLIAAISVCHAEEPDAIELINRVDSLLKAQRFNELETMAQEFRLHDSRLVGGNAKLHQYYLALGGIAERDYHGAISFEAKRQLLNKWLVEKPKSLAAHIGMAQLWMNYAWSTRGPGYVDEVKPNQWITFHTGIAESKRYLQDIDPKTDPHAYYLLLDLARDLSAPRPILDALYNTATHNYPAYFHYYSQRANILQERWYGKQGELTEYVQSVLKNPGGENGKIAYAYITFNLMQLNARPILYQITGLSWPQVKEAYAIREKRYGLRNKDWNALLNLALAALDRPSAKQALLHIGNNWDKQVWGEKKVFDDAVTWTRG